MALFLLMSMLVYRMKSLWVIRVDLEPLPLLIHCITHLMNDAPSSAQVALSKMKELLNDIVMTASKAEPADFGIEKSAETHQIDYQMKKIKLVIDTYHVFQLT